ncbi:UNVERIFIED_CONTAM: hypothetical protein N8J90_18905 [Halobacillus marinus]
MAIIFKKHFHYSAFYGTSVAQSAEAITPILEPLGMMAAIQDKNIAAPTVVFVVILVEGFLEVLTMSAVWHTIIWDYMWNIIPL